MFWFLNLLLNSSSPPVTKVSTALIEGEIFKLREPKQEDLSACLFLNLRDSKEDKKELVLSNYDKESIGLNKIDEAFPVIQAEVAGDEASLLSQSSFSNIESDVFSIVVLDKTLTREIDYCRHMSS